ncbi:hypothetical protein DFH08DRAFT_965560 [Mycena albidolilacea]|uniref:Uncharacterized protein n=1 Tax=Mycena albidolilacea TaxID=1033008 RepID=A0AAD6ZS95_9AGAR|nr:hypothetical protein DFH08DRAFT_965560 [Mycena albidolilacea]
MCSFININILAMAIVTLTVLCMAPSKVNTDLIIICQSFANCHLFRVDMPGNTTGTP